MLHDCTNENTINNAEITYWFLGEKELFFNFVFVEDQSEGDHLFRVVSFHENHIVYVLNFFQPDTNVAEFITFVAMVLEVFQRILH